MLQKFLESDFEFGNLDKSRLCFIKKNLKDKSPFKFTLKVFISLFFKFCNIMNIDLFSIHRFILVFWLFTGCYSSIVKYKVKLRLGIYYYHFWIKYNMKKRKFFYVLSFFLDELLTHQFWDSSKFINNNYILFFKHLEILTNYKLARGVYFHRIQQKFFFKVSFKNIAYWLFKIFLNSVKLLNVN